MSAEYVPEPPEVYSMVEQYVYDALSDAEKYVNSEPLDEAGVYGLHRLAASIYALGHREGHVLVLGSSPSERLRRDLARKRAEAETEEG